MIILYILNGELGPCFEDDTLLQRDSDGALGCERKARTKQEIRDSPRLQQNRLFLSVSRQQRFHLFV